MGEVDFSSIKVVEDWEQQAKLRIPKGAFDYVNSGSGKEETAKKNVQAFENWDILFRVLRHVENRNLETNHWGIQLKNPFMLAPVGFQTVIHPDGELASAKAAAAFGIPFMTSTVSSFSLEKIATVVGDTPKFFQLYWPGDDEICTSFIKRAEVSGYDAIVLTVDTPILGWRERDLQNQYFPLKSGHGMANYVEDSVFQEKYNPEKTTDTQELVGKISALLFNQKLTWDRIGWLKEQTSLPIILKGIVHPEDARLAKQYKVDGVLVSNHGGRQLDGSISSLDALPRVAAELKGSIPLLFDGGIRRGSDALKAMALGADIVLLGRLYAYGLAFGEKGVSAVLDNFLKDFDISLALAGITSISEINSTIIIERN